MERRKAAALIAGAGSALLARCGGGGPTGPSASSVLSAAGIPVLAHYANWWTIPGQWAYAATRPKRGIYTSADPAIIDAHNAEMMASGIVPLVSWWGPDAYAGDAFLNLYLSRSGPQLGLLYEAFGNQDRLIHEGQESADFNDPATAAFFIREMEHLRDTYFNGPSGGRFFRVNGRPVVFIWITNMFRGPFEAVAAQVREYVYLVGSEFHIPAYIPAGHEAVVRGLDAITAYGFYDTDRYPVDMNDEFLAGYTNGIRKWREELAANAAGVQLIPPMTFAYDERTIPGRVGYYFRSSAEVALRYAQIVRSYVGTPGVLPMAYCTSYTEHVEGSAIEETDDPERPDYRGIVRNVFSAPGP